MNDIVGVRSGSHRASDIGAYPNADFAALPIRAARRGVRACSPI